jgi:two-component system, OmpR family, sensor histidine kinase KdpD
VNATRAALFSSISHDLRTPLASITAAVTNLLEPSARISEVGRDEHLQTIREEAERLNRLVGSFLHLARVRAGAVSPEKQSVSLDDVIEGVVARLQPVLSGHRVRLVLRPDVPEIRADIDQLDQVLTNLLENAARHARGNSEIQISTSRWQSWVEVRVADHGPGIPPSDRERVFEPFIRAEPSTDGGTGLGLSIARALVEAHGGRIWITESPGGGTTVLFRLPVEG